MFFLCLDDTDGADEANDASPPFEDDDVEWRSTGDDEDEEFSKEELDRGCLLYTSPSPRD